MEVSFLSVTAYQAFPLTAPSILGLANGLTRLAGGWRGGGTRGAPVAAGLVLAVSLGGPSSPPAPAAATALPSCPAASGLVCANRHLAPWRHRPVRAKNLQIGRVSLGASGAAAAAGLALAGVGSSASESESESDESESEEEDDEPESLAWLEA